MIDGNRIRELYDETVKMYGPRAEQIDIQPCISFRRESYVQQVDGKEGKHKYFLHISQRALSSQNAEMDTRREIESKIIEILGREFDDRKAA